MPTNIDTITAQATPPGRGGVGIIRVSGPSTIQISQSITSKNLKPRVAEYGAFFDEDGSAIDMGIAILFKAPHSFTGEDVLELHAHGGQVTLNCILSRVMKLGARMARPGEFSERAFLNDKIDLIQAEAISDLINASNEKAARSAMRSLQGEFSTQIKRLVDNVIQLRMFVEAAIDFPEEEVEFLSDGHVISQVKNLCEEIKIILANAKQGVLIREGMTVVISGKPNAGKSSLLNALTGVESAIVSEIPGTTRDYIKEYIHINGLPLHIIDTAGLRQSSDEIEQIGIERAWQQINSADQLLLIVDASVEQELNPVDILPDFAQMLPNKIPITIIRNKIDLLGEKPSVEILSDYPVISLSARYHEGINLLREHLTNSVGFDTSLEGNFIARQRHVDALSRGLAYLENGLSQVELNQAAELLAEDLRLAQKALGEITGEFTSDDLLGKIFSDFCIGK